MSDDQSERLSEFIRCVEELDYEVDKETLEQLIIELKGERDFKLLLSTNTEDIVKAINNGPLKGSPCCSAESRDEHTIWVIHQWFTDWVHVVMKIYRDELIVKKKVYAAKFNRPSQKINEHVEHDGSIEDIVEKVHNAYEEYKYGSWHSGI
jgi:hypothetical protein